MIKLQLQDTEYVTLDPDTGNRRMLCLTVGDSFGYGCAYLDKDSAREIATRLLSWANEEKT